MSGAYSEEKSGSLASALSMSLHSCTLLSFCDDVSCEEVEERVEEEPLARLSSEVRLSSEWKLTSFSVVAWRKFCTAVTGVGSQSILERGRERERERERESVIVCERERERGR